MPTLFRSSLFNRSKHLAWLFITVLIWPAYAWANTSEALKEELLRDYRPAAKALEAGYRSLEYSGTLTRTKIPNSDLSIKNKIRFLSNGERLRVDISEQPDSNSPEKSEMTYVFVASPDGCFKAESNLRGEDYLLTRFSRNLRSGDESIYMSNALVPLTFCETTILAYLELPDLTVHSIESIEKDGIQLTKVRVQLTGVAPVSFWFDPQQSWALREYQWGELNIKHHEKINYRGRFNKIPLLAEFRKWSEEDDEEYNVETFVVETIQPGASPVEQFVPEALGIRDFVPPDASPGKRNKLVLLLSSLAFLLVAFLYWKRNRNESRKRT